MLELLLDGQLIISGMYIDWRERTSEPQPGIVVCLVESARHVPAFVKLQASASEVFRHNKVLSLFAESKKDLFFLSCKIPPRRKFLHDFLE